MRILRVCATCVWMCAAVAVAVVPTSHQHLEGSLALQVRDHWDEATDTFTGRPGHACLFFQHATSNPTHLVDIPVSLCKAGQTSLDGHSVEGDEAGTNGCQDNDVETAAVGAALDLGDGFTCASAVHNGLAAPGQGLCLTHLAGACAASCNLCDTDNDDDDDEEVPHLQGRHFHVDYITMLAGHSISHNLQHHHMSMSMGTGGHEDKTAEDEADDGGETVLVSGASVATLLHESDSVVVHAVSSASSDSSSTATNSGVGSALEPVITPPSSGPQNIILIRANYVDAQVTYCDEACVRNMMFGDWGSVEQGFFESSYGAHQWDEAASDVVTVEIGHSAYHSDYDTVTLESGEMEDWPCDTLKVREEALKMLPTDIRLRVDSYSAMAIFIPRISGTGLGTCTWGGSAWIGDTSLGWYNQGVASSSGYGSRLMTSWIRSSSAKTLMHEMGHTFGLHHAASDFDNDGVVEAEYGGAASCMGHGSMFLNGIERFVMDYNPTVLDLDDNTFTEVRLKSLATMPSPDHPSLIRFARKKGFRERERYWVELRLSGDDQGVDSLMPTASRDKVGIYWAEQDNTGLDLAPVSGQSGLRTKAVVYLAEGDTYRSTMIQQLDDEETHEFTLTVTQIDSVNHEATVEISLGIDLSGCGTGTAVCVAGETYLDTIHCDATNGNGVCRPCRSCSVNEHIAVPCTVDHDTECVRCDQIKDIEISGRPWHDADGPEYDCNWYSAGTNCEKYGNGYERDGYTANQACVACGGGECQQTPHMVVCGRASNANCLEPFCAEPSEQHEVRCCADSQPVGFAYNWHSKNGGQLWTESICDADAGGNDQTEDFAGAQALCAKHGGRLCTPDEMQHTVGTGCMHDRDMIWTSTTCEVADTADGNGGCVVADVEVSGRPWHDSDGPIYDCDWYGFGTNCLLYGDWFEMDGYTANEACVVCGGGECPE